MTQELNQPHYCTQAEAISRINTILVGNGHPEDGLAFMMRSFMIDYAHTKDDISDIKKLIEEFKKESIENAKSAAIAISAIEKFKLENETYDRAIQDQEDKERIARELINKQTQESMQRKIWIIMAAIALLGIAINTYIGLRNHKQLTTVEQTQSIKK